MSHSPTPFKVKVTTERLRELVQLTVELFFKPNPQSPQTEQPQEPSRREGPRRPRSSALRHSGQHRAARRPAGLRAVSGGQAETSLPPAPPLGPVSAGVERGQSEEGAAPLPAPRQPPQARPGPAPSGPCPAGTRRGERTDTRGEAAGSVEAPGKAEGSRLDVSPTEIGAVPQPDGRRAQRGSNRRDPARRRRSHTRHHFAPPPRWQPRCRPPGTAQPSPARPTGGRTRPSRTATARKRPGAVLGEATRGPAGRARFGVGGWGGRFLCASMANL